MSAVAATLRPIPVLAGWAMRESVRRRVFVIVTALTIGFLVLYALGCSEAFHQLHQSLDPTGPSGVSGKEFVGATLNGLSMFATFFLGCVLAAFLTLSTVRGDAENGLLQPLVVRPVGRAQVLIARWLAAALVCTVYVAVVYTVALLVLHGAGDWTPDRLVGPAVRMALAVAVFAALCVLGSVVLTSTANGITAFMVLGSGMFAGLLGQIGRAIDNHAVQHWAHIVSWGLPFEALYQDGLALTTADQFGLSGFLVKLGPLGGGEPAGAGLLFWAAAYLVLVALLAIGGTNRRDL